MGSEVCFMSSARLWTKVIYSVGKSKQKVPIIDKQEQ